MLTDQERKVLDLIDENRQDVIECLQTLIRFKTVTPQDNTPAEGDDYKDLQAYVAEIVRSLDFEVEIWEADAAALPIFPGSGVKPDRDLSNMPILAATRKGTGGGKSLILNGHYDVVPVGLLESWKKDPFGGEIEDGTIYGRGTNDMKGGIAGMLQALRFIEDAGVKLAGDVIVQIVPDEEASCMGTLSCCQRGYTADAAIIPEPTDMQVLVAVRGSVYGEITVYGRAGHAELTQPHWREGGAVNAITKAVKVIQGMEALTEEWSTRPDKQHKYLDPDMIIPTIIHGGVWSVTYPEKVEISFGSQVLPSTNNAMEEIEEKIAKVAALDPWMSEHPPEIKFNEQRYYGAEVDEGEPIVQLGLEVMEEIGYDPCLRGFGSLTDSIHLINYANIPTISIGPAIKTAHMADELVTIEELIDTTKALALAIMRWCGC